MLRAIRQLADDRLGAPALKAASDCCATAARDNAKNYARALQRHD
jgi:hypothetical protein